MTTEILTLKPFNTLFTTDSILKHLVALYGISKTSKVELVQIGVNDTYLLQSKGKKYIYRLYRLNLRSHQEIHFELDYLTFLKSKGVAVSDPLKNINNDYIVPIDSPEGLRYGVLFNYAQGKMVTYKDEEGVLASLYGEHVASMHLAQKEFSSKYNRNLNLDTLVHEPLAKIPSLFADHPKSTTMVNDMAQFVLERFDDLGQDQLTQGVCHGDTHCGNAHINTDDIITFFDFDCCGQGWLEYDLATFKWGSLSINKKQRYDHFLAGYSSINSMPISNQAINLLVAIRQIWLLGLHADSARLYGTTWYQQRYVEMNDRFFSEWKKGYLDNTL